jgi:hypothetical protein
MKNIHDDHEGRLGIDRLVAELATLGRRHSPQRVRRLTRAAGLSGVHPRPYRADGTGRGQPRRPGRPRRA